MTVADPQARGSELMCTVLNSEQSGNMLVGHYSVGDDKLLGRCVLRPAQGTLPQRTSRLPTWPLPLKTGQLWEMRTPQGAFVGSASVAAQGGVGGVWSGTQAGLLNAFRLDAGTAQEKVVFTLNTDQDDMIGCAVERSRDMGFAMDQIGSPQLANLNALYGTALNQPSGQAMSRGGECWIRPVFSTLK